MGGDDNPKRKKSKYLSLVLLLIVFVVFALLAALLIFGDFSCSLTFAGCFSPRLPAVTVNEYTFDVGRDRVFANIEGSVAAVGTLGVQVLDTGGRETLRDSFRMNRPAVAGSANYGIAFDIGGSAVRVFNASQVSSSIETDGRIISASINQNGWFCIATQEGGGSRGVVTVYNNLGDSVYRVSLGSGYVLSAGLSHDNKSLAILNLTDGGSRITFYHGIDTYKSEPDHMFDLPGGLIIDFWYKSNGDVVAISTDSLFIVGSHGNSRSLYEFPENRLGGYTNHNDFIALHLYDYGVGQSGRLITLLSDGKMLGGKTIDREIVSMSAADKALVLLKSDGLSFYNEYLEEFTLSADNLPAAGANRVLALREDTALAASDNSAVVIRREEER